MLNDVPYDVETCIYSQWDHQFLRQLPVFISLSGFCLLIIPKSTKAWGKFLLCCFLFSTLQLKPIPFGFPRFWPSKTSSSTLVHVVIILICFFKCSSWEFS